MPFSERALALACDLVARAKAHGFMLATAESCTGGLIAGCITEVPGASAVFTTGFVTYSNAAKTALLDVPEALFPRVGAVSELVARAMAEGAIARSGAALAVSATGIAGPGGGTAQKPVGLVHMAAARRDGVTLHHAEVYPGDRSQVRMAAVEGALNLLLRQFDETGETA